MSDFVEKLRGIVGDRGLVLDAAGKAPYLGDWRENFMGAALAIVRPAGTDEVAAVVDRLDSVTSALPPSTPAAVAPRPLAFVATLDRTTLLTVYAALERGIPLAPLHPRASDEEQRRQ